MKSYTSVSKAFTYTLGSNILDNMKHCVAIGGALDVGAGICGCGMAGIPGIPGGGTPGGRAGAPGGACCCRAGSPPIWFICRDLAAYSGIWNPVPGMSVTEIIIPASSKPNRKLKQIKTIQELRGGRYCTCIGQRQ